METGHVRVPFQIAVPRIVTFDPVAAAQQELAVFREQFPAFFRPATGRLDPSTQERIAVIVEQLRQAVASMSDLLEDGDTTSPASSTSALNMRVAELQMMVRRLQTVQEVGVPER